MPDTPPFLDTLLNLSRFHREHEKFYAQRPLQQAIDLQSASRVLKTLAQRWGEVTPQPAGQGNPYLGCEDLNEPSSIQSDGVLFLEGEGEPPELSRLKRDLATTAADFGETGRWLSEAMEASWAIAANLVQYAPLADVLGERHRIIANDWQAANTSSLASRLIGRALDILGRVDFSPVVVRADLAGPRVFVGYLNSAAELIDRAADLAAQSTTLTHDNDRRWRVFRERLLALTGKRDPDSAAEG
jgi:hypothetical protein